MEEKTTALITPYQKKPLSDSTLRGMTKDELIDVLRDYEHNYSTLFEAYNNSVAAAEKLLRRALDVEVMQESVRELAEEMERKRRYITGPQLKELFRREVVKQLPHYVGDV